MSVTQPSSGTNTTQIGHELWYGELDIHPHWLKYDLHQIPAAHFHTIALIVGVIGIIGTTGNVMVISTYVKQRFLRTAQTMLMVNLAVSDLIFTVAMAYPFMKASFERRWSFGKRACQLYGFTGGTFGLISIYSHAAIALRLMAMIKPIPVFTGMTVRRAGAVVALIWLWCAAISALPFLGFGAYIPEGFQTSCSFDYLSQDAETRIFNAALYILGFILPLTIIIYSYFRICRATRHGYYTHYRRNNFFNTLNAERQTIRVSVAVVAAYLISWTPYASVCLAGMLGYEDFVTPYVSEVPVVFAKASAIYNPIIYALSIRSFRIGLRKTFPICFYWISSENSDDIARTKTMVLTTFTSVPSPMSAVNI